MAFNVNADVMRGDNIFLYLTSGNTVLAYATSCSLEISADGIDTSNKMSGRWTANLSGKNGYTVNADALYTKASGLCSYDTLMTMMVAGDAVKWTMGTASGTTGSSATFALDEVIAKGEAFITSLSLNAGNNEVASCSITLTGSGAIETS